MDIVQIEVYLNSDDSQKRLQAIAQLRNHHPEVAVPLLKRRMYDSEFLVRSLVAMGLGNKRTNEGFEALIALADFDDDANVRAEAANSLSKFGEIALPHLLNIFERDTHWLVRRSILAVLDEIERSDLIYQICALGCRDDDLTVQAAAIDALGLLVETPHQSAALQLLCQAADDESWLLRACAARILSQFNEIEAKAVLTRLQYDRDHRVVGAVLERLL